MGIKSSEKAKAKHKKGLWSPEEDQRLKDYVLNHGHGCWSSVAINAGLKRNGKSCRLRWINYLRPGLKRGTFTKQEEDTILSLHRMLGNKWSQIAQSLPGRTDNEIKNYWHSYLKKKHIKINQETYTLYNTSTSSSSSKDMDFSTSPVNNPGYESLPQMAKSSNHTNQSYLIPRKPLFAEWVSLPDSKVNGRGIFVNSDQQLPGYKDGHLINDNISNLSVHDYVFMHDNYSLSEGEFNGDQLNNGIGYNNDNSFDGFSSSEFKFEDQISGISFDSVCGGFNNMNNNDVIYI